MAERKQYRPRPGSRVFWDGVFPDRQKTGTIVQTGTLRHEIRWDNKPNEVAWVNVGTVARVNGKSQWGDGW